jgi:hypothetical protein
LELLLRIRSLVLQEQHHSRQVQQEQHRSMQVQVQHTQQQELRNHSLELVHSSREHESCCGAFRRSSSASQCEGCSKVLELHNRSLVLLHRQEPCHNNQHHGATIQNQPKRW